MHVFLDQLSTNVCICFIHFGFEGRIWDLIVIVLGHCLLFYFSLELTVPYDIPNICPLHFFFKLYKRVIICIQNKHPFSMQHILVLFTETSNIFCLSLKNEIFENKHTFLLVCSYRRSKRNIT